MSERFTGLSHSVSHPHSKRQLAHSAYTTATSGSKGACQPIKKYLLYFVTTTMTWLLTTGISSAATYTVTNTNNSGAGSLRQAITNTNAGSGGDEIIFQDGLTGTISFDDTDNEIVIDQSVHITGPGADKLTIDASQKSRIFQILDGADVTIESLRFVNGRDAGVSFGQGGAIHLRRGNLSINACEFADNETTGSSPSNRRGGGIKSDSTTELNISNSAFFSNNDANDYSRGTAVYCGEVCNIVNSTFVGNGFYTPYDPIESSIGQAAIHAPNNATLNISFSTIARNNGGIFGESFAQVTVSNSVLAYNNIPSCSRDNFTVQNTYSDTPAQCGLPTEIMRTQDLDQALSHNGGPTQTLALLRGPAVAGARLEDCAAILTDQRNISRPSTLENCDAGAYEKETTVHAAITVTNTNNSGEGSLRQAILDANLDTRADEIVFQDGLTGTITFDDTDNEMLIETDVQIIGPGAHLLTIDANQKSRIFDIVDSPTVTMEGLRLINGYVNAPSFGNGGAIHLGSGNLFIDSFEFADNEVTAPRTGRRRGGAIKSGPFSHLQITNSTFFSNSDATGYSRGTAIYCGSSGNPSTCNIKNSTFVGNGFHDPDDPVVNSIGQAAIHATNQAVLNISFSTIAHNNGGIFGESSSSVIARNSVVAFNLIGSCSNDSFTMENTYSDTSDSCGLSTPALVSEDLADSLYDHGGQTPTLAVFSGPAIAGAQPSDCAAALTDQRGKPRPHNLETCDAGAYEKNPTAYDSLANRTCEQGKYYVIATLADLEESADFPTRSLIVVGDLTPSQKLKIRTKCALYLYPGITLSGMKVNVEAWSGVYALHGSDVPKSPFVVYDEVAMKYQYATEEDAGEEAANPKVISTGGQRPVADPPNHTDGAGDFLNAATVETNSLIPKRTLAKDVRITSRKGDLRIGQGATFSATDKLYLYAGSYYGCPSQNEPSNPALQLDRDFTVDASAGIVLLASGDVTLSRTDDSGTKIGAATPRTDLSLYSGCGDVLLDQDISVYAKQMKVQAYGATGVGGGQTLLDVTGNLSVLSTGKVKVDGRYFGKPEAVVKVHSRQYTSGVSGYLNVGGDALFSGEKAVVIETNAGIESVTGNFALEGGTCELQTDWNADTLISDPSYQSYCDNWTVPTP